ncbi:DUF2306 domain-containing protein [Microbulbifer sp. TYP-18]|uniref:DUF2306 domain-containing protein n=1 Tax=Microbulbifer sp. TYP-18 TaxID=3230024 RepID=UPI0034C69EAC
MMSTAVTGAARPATRHAGDGGLKLLHSAGATWLTLAFIGQLMLAAYVVGFYLRTAVTGDWQRWNQVLPVGYVEGDLIGNLVLGLHLLFTVFIIAGAALQLAPQVRRRWPRFHRWNGRFYLLSAVIMSLGGLYLVWSRESPKGSPIQDVAISINALLILACAAAALHFARGKRFEQHKRWALRLFLVVSGVWFFRVGLTFWLLVNQGPVGFDPKTLTGPFVVFLGFAQYLLPLALLEAYFRAGDSHSSYARLSMSACLGLFTLITATGIFAAAMMLWLPRLTA